MKEERKKKHEEFHIELFISLFNKKYPRCPIRPCKNSQIVPDGLIKSPDGLIGIEHTKLFKRRPQSEGIQDKILYKSQLICEKNGIPPIEVKVLFAQNSKHLVQKNIDSISRALAECIKAYVSDKKIVLSGKGIPLGLVKIHILPAVLNGKQRLLKHRLLPIRASQVKINAINEIQNRIVNKNNKYKQYIKNCGCKEVWLLIVADRSKPSQCFNISEETINNTYESIFDRTFYLEIMHEQLEELNCNKPIS